MWPDEREELKRAAIELVLAVLEFVAMWAVLMVPVVMSIGG